MAGRNKIQTRQKFTLVKVEHGVATINVDSQVLTPVHDPSIEAQFIQRLSDGTVRFDIVAGRVLSQQLDLDRHVIGFNGAGSSMHYVTRFTEKLLNDESTATTKPKAAPAAAPAQPAKPSRRPVASPYYVAEVCDPVALAKSPASRMPATFLQRGARRSSLAGPG